MSEPAPAEGYSPEQATPFQKSLELRWINLDTGVAVECDVSGDRVGPAGSLEGGVVATLIDVAGGSAAIRELKSLIATSDMTIHYLAPVRVGPARATAVPLRVGRDTAVIEVRVTDRGNADRLCATSLLSFRVLRPSV